jgi:multimeric flavodoxin WrbA
MKIVGISASPRRSGNSELLLDKALAGAMSKGADIEKIVLNELDFKACQECGGCEKTGSCIISDGMAHVYSQMDKADGVILASPIFFVSLSAQAKMMIDRFQSAWMAKYILKNPIRRKKRKGIFLSVAGSRKEEHFENARSIVRAFFATLDIEYSGELCCGGMEKASDIENDEKALNRAYSLGRDLADRDE